MPTVDDIDDIDDIDDTKTDINCLPHDTLVHILRYLGPVERSKASWGSRDFRAAYLESAPVPGYGLRHEFLAIEKLPEVTANFIVARDGLTSFDDNEVSDPCYRDTCTRLGVGGAMSVIGIVLMVIAYKLIQHDDHSIFLGIFKGIVGMVMTSLGLYMICKGHQRDQLVGQQAKLFRLRESTEAEKNRLEGAAGLTEPLLSVVVQS